MGGEREREAVWLVIERFEFSNAGGAVETELTRNARALGKLARGLFVGDGSCSCCELQTVVFCVRKENPE
jgi:hypothetical protein